MLDIRKTIDKILTRIRNIEANFVKKSGDTMTGQLKTSFKSSVATGSYCPSSSTIPDLCNELKYSSGCMGSVSITTAYSLNDTTVRTGWYNFIWIPHRSGGINGTASGDNCEYGSLLLSGMTRQGCFLIRYAGNAIAECRRIVYGQQDIVAGSNHAAAVKTYFNNNKTTICRNNLLSFYSSAYGNGSQLFGYYLNGYDTSPYGGFYVCQYNNARYVGISNGTYTDYELSKSTVSSLNTKENISLLSEEEANKIYNIEVISFDYKPAFEDGKKNQVGFSAEQVDKIFPNMVHKPPAGEDDPNPIWSIKTWEFIPYLTKTIQLQNERINQLEQRIEELEKKSR